MSVYHILRKTGDLLIGRLIELLFDITLYLHDDIICPVVRVGPLSASQARLVVIHHLLDLVHHLSVVAEIGEKLRNLRQLRHRHLKVKLLMVGALVLVVGECRLVHAVSASFAS